MVTVLKCCSLVLSRSFKLPTHAWNSTSTRRWPWDPGLAYTNLIWSWTQWSLWVTSNLGCSMIHLSTQQETSFIPLEGSSQHNNAQRELQPTLTSQRSDKDSPEWIQQSTLVGLIYQVTCWLVSTSTSFYHQRFIGSENIILILHHKKILLHTWFNFIIAYNF